MKFIFQNENENVINTLVYSKSNLMSGVPYGSKKDCDPNAQWSRAIVSIGGVPQAVVTPPAGVSVNTPSLSIGTTPTLTVGTIKQTVDELLGDNIDAPITCQALLDSADTAVFASSNSNGYHTLPPSGKKIHEHLSSGNITEIKTSGSIEAGKNLDVTSHLGRARISQGTYTTAAGTTGSLVTFSHHDCSGNDYALLQTDVGETMLNCKTGQRITFTNQGVEKMRVHSNGFVGINQVAPTVELEVSGDIKATNLTTTGSIESGSGDVMLRVMSGFQTNGNLVFGRADQTGEQRSSAINVSNSFLNSANKMTFLVHDGQTSNNASRTTVMTLTGDGRVGIGTTSPSTPYRLEVAGLTKSLGVLYGSTQTTKQWLIDVNSNGNLYFRFHGSSGFTDRGYLNQAVNVNDIDFTGQHRSKFEGDFTSELVGLIVESTGAYLELDGSVNPKIDEALPSVKLTTAAKSKRVYGVLSNIEGDTREYGSGFVTVVPKDDNITRVMVNSVGEGSLWVINTHDQSLENGDYICSSSVAGYGEKQDDDILHSYTVAKITMSLDWSNLPDWLETRNVTASGEVSETGEYKAAFVGVTYHCG